MKGPGIWLFADVLGGFGGIETYLDALARRLWADGWSVGIAVSLNAPAPFLDVLEAMGLPIYRQRRVPGDRWQVRERLLLRHVARRLRRGDWVLLRTAADAGDLSVAGEGSSPPRRQSGGELDVRARVLAAAARPRGA